MYSIALKLILWCCMLFLGGISAEAQQLQRAVRHDATIEWHTPHHARQLLLQEISVLEPQLAALTMGSDAYHQLLRRIAYYKGILKCLSGDVALADALDAALPAAATLDGQQERAFTPEPVLRTLYNEALQLLTN